jgi:GH25 family lysozyme M1 (1,4-beta-N-acetylmuramidase)
MAFPSGAVPGIDVSLYQSVVDWARVSAVGERFGFAKASEGISGTGSSDPYFVDNWSGMKAAGILTKVSTDANRTRGSKKASL